MATASSAEAHDGRLIANLMHFARTLRAAGLPVGPGKVLDAVAAVEEIGIADRRDFYWTLHAVFVNRADQRQLFEQAFHVFWRNPELLKKMLSLVLPQMNVEMPQQQGDEMLRRLAEALHPNREAREAEETELEFDAAVTFSDREQLGQMDFEKMSLEELARAKAAIARMRLPLFDVPTRRFAPDRRGARADMRATLRAALRSGGLIELRRKSRRRRPPPLVVLCDISGSMSRYSRLFLHFMHSITNDRDRVYTFVFGTRLTNITRYLRYRDVDLALDRVAEVVADWSGGTRIGACVAEFNRLWSRRVLGQGAVVLMITDGLDRDAGTGGSSPRPLGSKLAVDSDGAFIGSVSGGCVEGAVVTEALETIRDGKPRLLDFGVSNEQAWEVGLACGGKIEIFVERVE